MEECIIKQLVLLFDGDIKGFVVALSAEQSAAWRCPDN